MSGGKSPTSPVPEGFSIDREWSLITYRLVSVVKILMLLDECLLLLLSIPCSSEPDVPEHDIAVGTSVFNT